MKITACHQCGTELENGTHQCFSCRKKEYLDKKTPANTLPASVPKLLVDIIFKGRLEQVKVTKQRCFFSIFLNR